MGQAPSTGAGAALSTRIGWLLRTHRAASPDACDPEAFAGRVSAVGPSITAADILAVEHGTGPIDAALLRAYERVLGLAERTLLGPSEALSRVLDGRALQPPRVLPPPEIRRELDRIANVVRHGCPTGEDWLSLAQLLTQPGAVILPGFLEDEWLYCLVDELARSVGACYLSRSEALARIMGEELHALRLVALIRDRVQEAGAQASTDVLSIWGSGRDMASVDAAIAMLTHEEVGIRRGASVALLRRAVRGRLTDQHLALIGTLLSQSAQDDPTSLGEDAVALGRHVSEDLGRQLEQRTGRGSEDEPAEGSAEEVAAALATGSGLESDPDLRFLLQDVLGDEHPERRPRTALLISASPCGTRIARAGLQMQLGPDPRTARRAGRLVTGLARHLLPDDLTPLLRADDPEVRRQGLKALAHGPGIGPGVDLRTHLEDPETALTAVYAAGMSQHPALTVAAASPTAQVRRAARWWQRHGGRIVDPGQAMP